MKRVATTLLVAGLLATPLLALPPATQAAVNINIGLSVGVPPPPLPVYAQPIAPAPGYIWTPGYWAWDPSFGYYWVPGTWVMPPQVGLLWTPGWWGWSDGAYRWNAGYWATTVGFYGGVNYGYGYYGNGYSGGYWRGRQFYYNRAVNNVNVTNIRNVYVDRTVIRNASHVSYNGGRGGLAARPSTAQRPPANQRRFQATANQVRQREAAMRDPHQRVKGNHDRPAVYATQQAARFEGPHAVRAPERAAAPRSPAHRAPTVNPADKAMVRTPRERAPSPGRPENRPARAERTAPMRPPVRERPTAMPPRGEPGQRGAPPKRQANTHPAPRASKGHDDRKHDGNGH